MRLIVKSVQKPPKENPELLVWQSMVYQASYNR